MYIIHNQSTCLATNLLFIDIVMCCFMLIFNALNKQINLTYCKKKRKYWLTLSVFPTICTSIFIFSITLSSGLLISLGWILSSVLINHFGGFSEMVQVAMVIEMVLHQGSSFQSFWSHHPIHILYMMKWLEVHEEILCF